MPRTQNMWSWKDSEIKGELERMNITLDGDYNRKLAIDTLKMADVKGEIKKTKTMVEEMKAKEPTLELRKVIFHSIGEQDMPYVFVGHNGKAYYIPKEIEVDVPVYILNSCIKDAVEDRLFPETQMDGSIEWKSRRVQRYPYSYAQ
jgi:hypothetical protein